MANLRRYQGLWVAGALVLLGGWLQGPPRTAAEEAPAAGESGGSPVPPEPSGPLVRRVEIKGLKHVPEHNVRDVLQTREGQVFSNEALLQDVNAILNLGYFVPPEMDPEGVQAIPEELPDGSFQVTFEVKENPLIQKVQFEGNHLFSGEELLTALKFLRPGQVWNWNNIEADLENLDNYYQERDYVAFARPGDPFIDEEGTVHLVIDEMKIGKIHFVFLDPQNKPTKPKTKEKVLRREMESKPGSYFSNRKLSEDMRRIFNLNLFEDVRRKELAAGAEPNTVDVTLEIKEKERTGVIAAGAGYSSRYGVVGFADVSETNLQGMARQVSARFEFGGRRSYDLSFFEPWLDRRRSSLNLSLYDTSALGLDTYYPAASGNFQRSRDYDQRRQGFLLGLGRPVDWDTRLGIELKSEAVETKRGVGSQALPSLPPFPFQELGRDSTRSLGLSLTRDTRDVLFDPSTGGRLSVGVEFAGRLLGGDNDFTKYNLEARKYWPIGSRQIRTESEERKVPRQVLAVRVKYGGSSGRLPFSQVYFVGGSDTLRGYEEDRWFGNRMFLLNLEYRHRFQPSLQGVAFFDLGRAWREGEPLNLPDSLASAFGFGIRVKTPLGPLRLDYGIGSEGGRTSFGFAQQF
jgi:outer membrane protein insertion porin family